MAGRVVKVGLVQMSTSDDKRANVDKALDGVKRAAAQGAQVVCLQELFAGPYFCQVEDADLFDLAEPLDGPTLQRVAAAASAAELIALLGRIGYPVQAEQVRQLPSICCGGCSG